MEHGLIEAQPGCRRQVGRIFGLRAEWTLCLEAAPLTEGRLLRRYLFRDGDLVRHLEGFGLRCTYQGDIRTGRDALELDNYGAAIAS